jgi:LmbE family N-acetylglucosaminyl deacetylase
MYGFASVHDLGLPTTLLDTLPLGDIVQAVSRVFNVVRPEVVYLPYRGDAHSDHKVVFDAAAACTKSFRYPSIRRVLAYEALSETDFGIDPDASGFRPNVFNDISAHLEDKIAILKVYASELEDFPFPRSEQAVRALAALRGVVAATQAAEAFMLLKELA